MRDEYLQRRLRDSFDSIVVDANPQHARYRTAARQRLNSRMQLGIAFAAGAAASFILLGLSGSSAPERVTVGLVSTLREIAGDERSQPAPSPHAETGSPSPNPGSVLPAPASQPSGAPGESDHHDTERGTTSPTPGTGQSPSSSGFRQAARCKGWVRQTNLKGGIENNVMMRRFILLATAFAGGALIVGGAGTASVYLLAPAASISTVSSPEPKESSEARQAVVGAPEPADSHE